MLDAFPRGQSTIEYDQPLGDPGIFGPDSITWRIHSEFPGMLSGGLCALMLQLLHPRALAGVYDHSDFRTDLIGRLRRTTNFVAGTTYAPRAEAEQLIARVRNIHSHIRGRTADGVPYDANDPQLLTWVHVTEAYGFLQGCRRYCRDVPADIADRYYDQARRVAEALGAADVPASEAQVDAYFASVLGELRMDARARSARHPHQHPAAGARGRPVAPRVSRCWHGLVAQLGWRHARPQHHATRAGARIGTIATQHVAAVSHGLARRTVCARVPAHGVAASHVAGVA
ncbi:DUF2236 domain-containing protein [Xanthomonas oryzae pv. oryzae]|uniref:DUF2236 domain-containing protein n=16 Tax=Xanthomonas oryzae TaxID=347 RepID=A0A854CJ15_XANOO|nr:oxygenase MpaB family protein [Xanthomonas oryzae]ACD61179.1 hypothetical protein PXO_03038 [Xanthomonas oryzae pv. oryzae PXO99A]ALZ73447.1 hypothetical protein APZ20_20165 [Xanthomonas oryzae pv. oryzae]AOS01194.1 hypothetical protein ATY42_03065 [Xanthomonas oryzae pv. oryzae]AOS08073.1 hypothetical protein ATY43_21050 [Xanthomonas oryzae pv. oryzae]AOS12256.1 hypothetical protein ATY44_20330 [Xanthomonas oryzae pv. oryzae]